MTLVMFLISVQTCRRAERAQTVRGTVARTDVVHRWTVDRSEMIPGQDYWAMAGVLPEKLQ